MAVVKHSSKITAADLVKHNETVKKRAEMWQRLGSQTVEKEATVESIQANPGYYIKDIHKGFIEWRGPFASEQSAKDWHAEMSWERKHS